MGLTPVRGSGIAYGGQGELLGRLQSGIMGMNFFFPFTDFQRWGGKGGNEPLLLSNKELICTIVFFNKIFQ